MSEKNKINKVIENLKDDKDMGPDTEKIYKVSGDKKIDEKDIKESDLVEVDLEKEGIDKEEIKNTLEFEVTAKTKLGRFIQEVKNEYNQLPPDRQRKYKKNFLFYGLMTALFLTIGTLLLVFLIMNT